MVVNLQNHSGITTVLQVSRGGAATHIAQIVQQGAVRRHHKALRSPGRHLWQPTVGWRVLWCYGVICQVLPPQEQLPAVPTGPEQHNTAASAMPCRAAHVPPPPPPPPARSLPKAARLRQSPNGPHGLLVGTQLRPTQSLPRPTRPSTRHAQLWGLTALPAVSSAPGMPQHCGICREFVYI